MSELEMARKILNIANDLLAGIDTTRVEILEEAGRARFNQIKQGFEKQKNTGWLAKLGEEEGQLHCDIIASLDQMSRRMPLPLPDSETDRVEKLINELDNIRSSRDRLPVSPGISIWRGAVELRRHQYRTAFDQFDQAATVLRSITNSPETVPPTLVTALCEGAYSLAMLGEQKKSIVFSDEAISIARDYINKINVSYKDILRNYFVAGEAVTSPLATSFLTACDVRINLVNSWDAGKQLENDFIVYWNLLNDECGGLSSLEPPYLIAILSDRKWMTHRPDLAAPIARALYLKSSSNIVHAQWRKANLFFGGFRFSEELKKSVSKSPRLAALLLVIFLGSPGDIALASNDLDAYFKDSKTRVYEYSTDQVATQLGGKYKSADLPSGSEIVEQLHLNDPQSQDAGVPDEISIREIMEKNILELDLTKHTFKVATGSSSLVASNMV